MFVSLRIYGVFLNIEYGKILWSDESIIGINGFEICLGNYWSQSCTISELVLWCIKEEFAQS